MNPTTRNRVAVLHGVNFDVLERRDASLYGGRSLSGLEQEIDGWDTTPASNRFLPDQP